MTNLVDLTVREFSDELASSAPAPGGGSAAALAGALAAGLMAMVCRLTIGRKGYEEASAELDALLPRAEALRQGLLTLMQADSDAYTQVIAAYKRPKATDEEKQARQEAVQAALREAAEVPLQIAKACAEVLEMAQTVAAKGNKNAASDAGAGGLLADAGLAAAKLNVEINLGLLQDKTYVEKMRRELNELDEATKQRRAEIVALVQTRM